MLLFLVTLKNFDVCTGVACPLLRRTGAVASGPAGQAMAGPVLINYVDTHAQMHQLSGSAMRVESRLNILHSCLDLLAASFFAMANLLP